MKYIFSKDVEDDAIEMHSKMLDAVLGEMKRLSKTEHYKQLQIAGESEASIILYFAALRKVTTTWFKSCSDVSTEKIKKLLN